MNFSDIKEPITCTVKELADRLAIDVDSVARLARQGVLRKAKRGEYLLIESMEAYVVYQRQSPSAKRAANESSDEPEGSEAAYERHRARLYKERADKAVMDNARLRGELHDAVAVAAYMGPMIANFRAKILSLPNACAAVVAGLSSAEECKNVLDDHCREACNELSDYDPAAVAGKDLEQLAEEIEEEPIETEDEEAE